MSKNNRLITGIFILFLLIVFFGSLKTASKAHQAVATQPAVTTILLQPTAAPSPTPVPTALPTPTMIPIQHPGYRINGNFGDD